jgi:hypothetical protein
MNIKSSQAGGGWAWLERLSVPVERESMTLDTVVHDVGKKDGNEGLCR